MSEKDGNAARSRRRKTTATTRCVCKVKMGNVDVNETEMANISIFLSIAAIRVSFRRCHTIYIARSFIFQLDLFFFFFCVCAFHLFRSSSLLALRSTFDFFNSKLLHIPREWMECIGIGP